MSGCFCFLLLLLFGTQTSTVSSFELVRQYYDNGKLVNVFDVQNTTVLLCVTHFTMKII
jgi:isocitrate lyase